MKYLSVCSGIEAASVAWHPLGWKALALSEIEAFPRAVLAHHYPGVPLHGDFTVLREESWIAGADILVGGTPCQAFSVAGLRNSLSDDRGNLTLEFVRLADAIDDARHADGREPAIIVWENVPGVLSVKDNAFGCFLAALAGEDSPLIPAGGRWTDAGLVDGPRRRIAWRILDAQYFGLAQRRRRVFVVASARDGFDPFEVLSERDGVQRYSPPRREAGKVTPASLGNGPAVDFRHEQLTGETVHTLQSKSTGGYSLNYMPGVLDWPADIAPTLNAAFGEKQGLEDQHIRGGGAGLFVPASAIGCGFDEVAHTLRGEGFDASADGTGRGTPLVPVAVPLQEVGKRTGTSTDDPRAGIGIGQDGDPMFILQAGAQHGVAQAVSLRGREGGGTAELGDEVQNALRASQGGGDKPHVLTTTNGVKTYANAAQTGPVEALRTLRSKIGEEAFTVWGFGILAAFQPPEILRSALHGGGLRQAAFSRSWLVCCALGGAEHGPGWLLQSLQETECAGCPPQGWEPSEQLARQLGAYLSKLSQPGASAQGIMHDLWCASEGPGVLREALSAVQEMGRPARGEAQPAHATMAVRRLTATECEFLQGFPRGYTAIPWRGKPADQCPDGPRYKALGNSMAVPVMAWIGQRIAAELSRASTKDKAA